MLLAMVVELELKKPFKIKVAGNHLGEHFFSVYCMILELQKYLKNLSLE